MISVLFDVPSSFFQFGLKMCYHLLENSNSRYHHNCKITIFVTRLDGTKMGKSQNFFGSCPI